MWIERADLRLMSDVEIRTSQAGNEYAVFRASFPGPKDSGRDFRLVWFGVRAFGDIERLRGAGKGGTVTFRGKLESSNWTTRDGEERTEPQLVIQEVLDYRAAETPPAPSRQTLAGIGQKHAAPITRPRPVPTPAPDATLGDLPALDDDERMPF